MKKYLFLILTFYLTIIMISAVYATDKNPLKQSLIIETSFEVQAIKGEMQDTCVLKDGSVIVVGTATKDQYLDKRTQGDLNSTSLIYKYSKDGKLVKIITYGGENNDIFTKVIATSDGGFVVSGATDGFAKGDYEKYKVNSTDSDGKIIVKFDKDCNVLWLKAFTNNEISNISSLNEGANGELYGSFEAGINDLGIKMYLFRFDKNGNTMLDSDLTEIPVYIDGCAYKEKRMDNGERYIWGYKDSPLKHYVAFISKIDKDGKLVYTKFFEGSGNTSFNELIFTPDGNMIILGSYLYCTSGEDFDKLNMNLKDRTSSHGLMIILCDKNGNFIKGINIPDPAPLDHVTITNYNVLSDGDILFHYRPVYNNVIYNYINNKKIESENYLNSVFLYRMDKNLNMKALYELEYDCLISVRKIEVMPDGSFRLISMSNYESFKLRVVNVADKYELDKAIDDNEDLVESNYTEQTWNVFNNALNKAIGINSNTKVSQSEVNNALGQLKSAAAALEKISIKEEPLATNTPTPTNKAEDTPKYEEVTPEKTINPISTDTKNDVTPKPEEYENNNFNYSVVIGISAVSLVIIGAFVFYVKQKKSK